MAEQMASFDQLEAFRKNDDSNNRQVSQEPERIEDEVFVRVCTSCDGIGIDQLAPALQPLLEKLLLLSSATGGESPTEMPDKGTTLKEVSVASFSK